MTVQQAFDNIVNITESARLTGPERDAVRQSIGIIVKRCNIADELEKSQKKEGPDEESN